MDASPFAGDPGPNINGRACPPGTRAPDPAPPARRLPWLGLASAAAAVLWAGVAVVLMT
ncbi:hypothetical protein [Frigidibacter oleivorans]|uniref:hypothetical protein n=1 Tax=Frigidibacter oleivorans TaxID=2487129 RepID=UPI0013E0DEC1|nr:hypothetical protein [Frigidibacter oleivorans]